MLLNKAYYTFKFLIPRRLQIQLRRYFVKQETVPICKISGPSIHNAGKPPGRVDRLAGWERNSPLS